MSNMKDSGTAWIGQIPDSWEMRPLFAILNERKEKNNPQKTDFILSLGASYGVIPYAEKTGGGNKAKEDLTAYRLAYPGDIVMNSMNIISGSVGISKYYGCVSPVYYMLYPRDENTDANYYHLLFQTTAFQRSLLGLGNGIMMKESANGNFNTVRMRIPMDKLKSLQFPYPSIDIQKRISSYLDIISDRVEKLIQNVEEQIGRLLAYKQSLITEIVTSGLNPNVTMKDSEIDCLGNIPSHWDICRVRNIGTPQNGISKGGEYFGEGYPFVSYGDVYRNYSLPTEVAGLIQSTPAEQENYSVQAGDIFFTRTSETIEEVGFSCVCEETIPNATFAGFLIRLRPFNEKMATSYAKYYFRSSHLRRFLVKEMNIVTRASLGQNLLKNIPVLLPPMEEQLAIAKELDLRCQQIDRLIAIKQEKIDKLNQYKKSLIYEYVTGKKEVS